MKLGYIGLGKMGTNMVLRLREHGHEVVAYDKDAGAYTEIEAAGAQTAANVQEFFDKLGATPRTVWLMVPWQAVDGVIGELEKLLSAGDTVIDGGNSPFGDSVSRAARLSAKGIHFLDAGVSGGPAGARNGACMMVGGERAVYEQHEELLKDLCVENGCAHVGKSGAGHFVKMVHNGIEYGMMQAMAEGFDVLQNSGQFELDVKQIADLYSHGSVIESRLMTWLTAGFQQYGTNLTNVSGSAAASGEGEWTVALAQQAGISHDVIKASLTARQKSQAQPNYQGKIISTLRTMFGGHDVSNVR